MRSIAFFVPAIVAVGTALESGASLAEEADWRKVGPREASAVEAAADRDIDAIAAIRRPRPLWEIGVGLSAVSFPDYRGSSHRSNYLLPIPYAVYRGPTFKLDRSGLRAELAGRGRVEVEMSLNASVPVRSRSGSVRDGMPNLKPTVEIGPQLQANLWRSEDGRQLLQFQLPLRYAFALSTGSDFNAGWVLHPRLLLDTRSVFGLAGWNVGLVAGPIFSTARQHNYFYGVDPRYATASRPAYATGGGYSGFQVTLGFARRWRTMWLGGFARVDDLHGAAFAASPLVETRRTWAAGLGFTWIFAESEQMVVQKD